MDSEHNWIVYEGDGDYTTYATEAEALAAADEALDSYRDLAAEGGWDEDEVARIVVARVTHRATVTLTQPPCAVADCEEMDGQQPCDGGHHLGDGYADAVEYGMVLVEAQP